MTNNRTYHHNRRTTVMNQWKDIHTQKKSGIRNQQHGGLTQSEPLAAALEYTQLVLDYNHRNKPKNDIPPEIRIISAFNRSTQIRAKVNDKSASV